jgi:glucose/arabinose dehydrogenase
VATAAVVGLAGCAFGDPPPDETGTPTQAALPQHGAQHTGRGRRGQHRSTVIAKNLDVPWAIAFLPTVAPSVTERDTRRILKVGRSRTPTARRHPGADDRGGRTPPARAA